MLEITTRDKTIRAEQHETNHSFVHIYLLNKHTNVFSYEKCIRLTDDFTAANVLNVLAN